MLPWQQQFFACNVYRTEMSSFKFEVNWTLNGVDMTTQTHKHGSYEGTGQEVPPVQIPHMDPYKMCIDHIYSINVQFTSNLISV